VNLVLFLTVMQGKVWGQDRFWYKADGTTQYNGTTWNDETSNHNNATRSGGTISLVANTINFNPSLSFTSINRQMRIATSTSVTSFVVVDNNTMTTDAYGLIGSSDDYGIRLKTGGGSWQGDGNSNDWSQNVVGQSRINGSTGWTFSKWHIVNQYRSSAYSSQFYIGGYYSSSSRPFTEVLLK